MSDPFESTGQAVNGGDDNPLQRIDWRRFVLVLVRRWRFILTLLILFTAIGVGLALPMRGRAFEASAVILYSLPATGVAVGEGAHFELPRPNIDTLVDTVKLPSNLKAIVERLDLGIDFRDLTDRITLSKAPRSNLIVISGEGETRQEAVDLANTAAEVFVEYLKDLRRLDAKQAIAKLESLIADARASYSEASDKLTAFRKEHGIVKLDVEAEMSLEKVGELKAQIEEAKIQRDMLDSRIHQLSRAGGPAALGESASQQRLENLRQQYAQMKMRYTEANPRLQKLSAEIEAAEQNVTTNEKARLQVERQSVANRIRSLTEQKTEIEQTLAKLTENEKAYATVQQQYLFSRQMVQNLMARRAEASAATSEAANEFRIIEQAVSPRYPKPSKAKLVAAAGPILGLFLALFLVLGSELLNPRLASAREVYHRYKLPIVGQHLHDSKAPKDQPHLEVDVFKPIVSSLSVSKRLDERQVIGVFSTVGGSGQTSVCENLAAAFAARGERALVLSMVQSHEPGDRVSIGRLGGRGSETAHVSVAAPNGHHRLKTFYSEKGVLDQACIHILPKLIERLRSHFAYILIDAPPLFETPPGVEIAALSDAIIMIARARHTHKDHFERVTRLLSPFSDRIMGAFISCAEPMLTRRHEIVMAGAYRDIEYGRGRLESWLTRRIIGPETTRLADMAKPGRRQSDSRTK